MLVFTLKTVFALFTFFTVVNTADIPTNCKHLDRPGVAALQLFNQPRCFYKDQNDYQVITTEGMPKNYGCVCQDVKPAIRKHLASFVFESGGGDYLASFTFFVEEKCVGLTSPTPPVPEENDGKMLFGTPGHPEIQSVEVCKAKKTKGSKKKVKAPKKANPAGQRGKIHKVGEDLWGVWRNIAGDAVHGIGKLVGGHISTKTDAEALGGLALGTVGAGAAGEVVGGAIGALY
ncbi:hypothetical protein BJ138DRAFT_1104041 [Hygrophoropsis aurantiaca]|uniref:Uncharacterized protein n=1 Tax=Hygrophoropsis aurantiaca TaxID=72124 RepID=A0ACB8A3M3_9AGAM|nr:hypothetical protein BJ138DRAFT_1104041 [Hygrophoropsis aurantiaca]